MGDCIECQRCAVSAVASLGTIFAFTLLHQVSATAPIFKARGHMKTGLIKATINLCAAFAKVSHVPIPCPDVAHDALNLAPRASVKSITFALSVVNGA